MLLAYRFALASPRVSAAGIEASEFRSLAERMDVMAVPKICIDGRPRFEGNVPEPVFLRHLLAAART